MIRRLVFSAVAGVVEDELATLDPFEISVGAIRRLLDLPSGLDSDATSMA